MRKLAIAGYTCAMRRTVALLAVCGITAGVLVSLAQSAVHRRAATLGIAAARPLTVAGRNFRPHERVRVTATVAGEKTTRAVTAGQTGRFRVEFEQLGATRCDLVRIVAVRRSGRAVVVKRLPAPACSTG